MTGKNTINIKNSSSEADGKTFATIGLGNLHVGEISHNGKAISKDLGGINRDLENNKVVTGDEVTGAMDTNLELDHRLFSEAGRKDKLDDILDLPQDIADIVLKVAWDGYSAVKGVIDGNNKEREKYNEFLRKIKANPDLAIKYMNLYEEDPAKAKEILQNLSDYIEDDDRTKKEREEGKKGKESRHNDEVMLYNDDNGAYGYNYNDERDKDKKEEIIGINSSKLDLNDFGKVLSVMLLDTGYNQYAEKTFEIINKIPGINNVANLINLEPLHEHIFFEDEIGGNIGFMGDGIGLVKDKEENLNKYKFIETDLDDKTVK